MSSQRRATTESPLSTGDETTEPTAPRRKKKSPWRYVRRTLFVLVVLALVIPAAGFAFAYSRAVVPQPSDMRTNQVATIFASDGTTVVAKVVPPDGNRTEVPLDAVPVHVRDAVFAAEDQNFYDNPGFSISGFIRAARDNVLGREDAGGGSTITQQYVKNVLVGRRPHRRTKARGVGHRVEDGAGVDQGRDPCRLPEHHLLRARCLRHRRRLQRLLR